MKQIAAPNLYDDMWENRLFKSFVGACVVDFMRSIKGRENELHLEKYRVPDEIYSELLKPEIVLIKMAGEDEIYISYTGE